MTSKDRAYLRSLAVNLDTIMQVGKDGVNDNMIKTVNDALEARELIKLRTLESCGLSPREAAEALAGATGAEVVMVIGSKFVLYRESKTKKKLFVD